LNKLPRKRFNIFSLYFISVSLTGLFLLVPFTFYHPTLRVNVPWQKRAVGLIFGFICLLGIAAGVYPPKCSRMLHFQKGSQSGSVHSAEQGSKGKRIFEGHHPSCGNFSAHVFQLGGKTYCAGCTGLVIGATVSLLGSLVYSLTDSLPGSTGVVFFWFGLVGVSSGLLQYNLLNVHKSLLHMFLNVIFVLGAFFLLVGIEEITSNLVLDVYFLALTLFWILTRIMLSQQEHKKICLTCGLKPCGFLE